MMDLLKEYYCIFQDVFSIKNSVIFFLGLGFLIYSTCTHSVWFIIEFVDSNKFSRFCILQNTFSLLYIHGVFK